MDYTAFDLEVATPLPEERSEWISNLGICCAATLRSDETEPLLWYAGSPFSSSGDEPYRQKMSSEECLALVDYLVAQQSMGFQIATWNGAAFDMRVLADECESGDIVDLMLNHIDPAFQMLCEKGYMIGLDAAAHGMSLEGKTEGMHGDLAPLMWAESREDQDKVLEYVAQDVRVTMAVIKAIEEKKHLRWLSRSLKWHWWQIPQLLTVKEANELVLPDTSWMTKPRMRADCIGWIGEEESAHE